MSVNKASVPKRQVLFCCLKGTNMKIPVYCPKCGKKVLTYDGKSSMVLSAKCLNCDVLVVFKAWEIKLKPIPQKQSSAGSTFY